MFSPFLQNDTPTNSKNAYVLNDNNTDVIQYKLASSGTWCNLAPTGNSYNGLYEYNSSSGGFCSGWDSIGGGTLSPSDIVDFKNVTTNVSKSAFLSDIQVINTNNVPLEQVDRSSITGVCNEGFNLITLNFGSNSNTCNPKSDGVKFTIPAVAAYAIEQDYEFLKDDLSWCYVTGLQLPVNLTTNFVIHYKTCYNNTTTTDSYTLNVQQVPGCFAGIVTAIAVDDTFTVSTNTTNNTLNLSTNDTLCNMGVTSFSIATSPSHGSLANFNTLTGAVDYTPTTNYVGSDSFTYNILCDGIIVDTATVTITVANVAVVGTISGNNNPVCGSTQTYTFTQTAGDPILTYSWVLPTGLSLISGQGTSTINVSFANPSSGSKIITLNTTNPGAQSFNYTVNVTCGNAVDDIVTTPVNTPVTIVLSANDTSCN